MVRRCSGISAGFVIGIELRVLRGDGDDLVVALAGVDHGHQADGARVDQRQRHHRFLAEHQHVERIVVFGQRLRNETVVGRIVHRRVQHAVQLDQAALLVQFVLHAGAERNLDDRVEIPAADARRERCRAMHESWELRRKCHGGESHFSGLSRQGCASARKRRSAEKSTGIFPRLVIFVAHALSSGAAIPVRFPPNW